MTSNNNQKLPTEILTQIFSHLLGRKRMVCQLVCKSWNLPAKEEFYRSTTVKGHLCSQKLLSCLEQTESTIGLYIKQLTISLAKGENRKRLPPLGTADTTSILLDNCPNMVKICLDKKVNPFYMFLNLKIQTANKVPLQKFSKISFCNQISQSPSVHRFYHLVNLSHASTIASLSLLDSPYNVEWFKNEQGGFRNYLSQFTTLQHLSIRNKSGASSSHMGLPIILSSTSKLNKIKLYCNRLKIGEKDFSSTKEYPSLKKLKLDVVELTVTDIKYILSTFPNLEYFYINSMVEIKWSSDEEKVRMVDLYKQYSAKLKDTNFIID